MFSRKEIAGWAGLFLGLTLAFYAAFRALHYPWNGEMVWGYRWKFAVGWLVTVAVSAGALAGSVVVGTAAALARRSRFLLLRQAATLYVELVRGTPLLVQILLLYYIVGEALGLDNRYLAGAVILALFGGAYLAEIVRAGIESVGASQWEAARAVGLTTAQTYRFVVAPQALRQMLPPLAGQFASLIKDSSLLSVIAVDELTKNAREVNAFTYATLESYLPLAAGYLVLTLPLSLWTRRLEERLRYET